MTSTATTTTTSSTRALASEAWLEETSSASTKLAGNGSMGCCRFNQDGGCLAVGGSEGFGIYNLEGAGGASSSTTPTPNHHHRGNGQHSHGAVEQTIARTLPQAPIVLMEMLFRCNLLAFVGQDASHRVLIWDDHVQKAIGELSFRQSVLNVKLRRDAIAIALRDRTFVYHLSDLSLRDKIYTADNPHGLLSISTSGDMVLACPSVTEGHVRVELYGLRKTVLMEAHESSLRALALTEDGSKLATASGKGTVIRVWQVQTSTLLQEFRRGVERVTITCLVWNPSSTTTATSSSATNGANASGNGSNSGTTVQQLACTSDKGTTHIFELNVIQSAQKGGSPVKKASLTQSVWSAVKSTVSLDTGYDGSGGGSTDHSKSVAQVRGVPHPLACAFVGPNLLGVCGHDLEGNGVLLIADYSNTNASSFISTGKYHHSSLHHASAQQHQQQSRRHNSEAIRRSYHVLCRNPQASSLSEETKRRRRLIKGYSGKNSYFGGTSASKNKNNTENDDMNGLYIGERVEVLENQLTKIQFEEEDGGFLSVAIGGGQDESIMSRTSAAAIHNDHNPGALLPPEERSHIASDAVANNNHEPSHTLSE